MSVHASQTGRKVIELFVRSPCICIRPRRIRSAVLLRFSELIYLAEALRCCWHVHGSQPSCTTSQRSQMKICVFHLCLETSVMIKRCLFLNLFRSWRYEVLNQLRSVNIELQYKHKRMHTNNKFQGYRYNFFCFSVCKKKELFIVSFVTWRFNGLFSPFSSKIGLWTLFLFMFLLISFLLILQNCSSVKTRSVVTS